MRSRSSSGRLRALLLVALATLGGAAHAAGTAAGTDIHNAATLTYSVGGVAQGSICSSPSGNSTSTCQNTTFKVDSKIDVLVGTTDVAPGVTSTPGGSSTLTFTVTNKGNSPQGFSFATVTNLSGSVGSMFGGAGTVTDAFDPTSCTIYDSTNTATTSVASLAAEASVTLTVVCAIPAGRSNNEVAAVALKATATAPGGGALVESATNDPTVVDIVFADVAGPDDAARDAAHSARSAFIVSTAAIQVAKTFRTICDPAGGDNTAPYVPKSIPGAYVQYTVTISNAATAGGSATRAAILTAVADALDTAKVTFDTELIAGANVGGVPRCAATTAPTNPGVATSVGNSFKVTWTGGARASFPGGIKYLPAGGNYTAPNINVNWATVLPVEGAYTDAGQLLPGDSVTLTYNVIIR